MSLQTTEHIFREILGNALSSGATLSGHVGSINFRSSGSRKEAMSIARSLDFNIADFGVRNTAEMRATEVMARRLSAVAHADQHNNDWEVAQHLEEKAADNLAPKSVTRRVQKSEKLVNISLSSKKVRGKGRGREKEGGDK